jgi:molecular chaperone GrpE
MAEKRESKRKSADGGKPKAPAKERPAGRETAASGDTDSDAALETGEGIRADGPNAEDAAAPDVSADAAADTETGAETSESPDASGDSDDRYRRLAADFQNYKKRTEKEKSDIYAYANEKFAEGLLEVIDNFERAIGQDAGGGADEKFIKGMELIMDQLVNVLAANDVEEIAALGEEFDPNVHHAVQMAPSKEFDSGKVMNVIQKGYRIRGKVLRPAMVVVAQ